MTTASCDQPFAGLLIADFTHVLAGPACAYYFGLLGADVIKVESVNKGDAIRHRGGTDRSLASQGMSTSYLTQGAGKRSLAIDLKSNSGQDAMSRLLRKADVFIENHLPSTMQELGLDEATIADKFPHLIHCAMTGYGRGGKQANAPAYDVNVQAACGIMTLTGTEQSGPTRTGAPILDYGTALAAAFAIASALYHRKESGVGGFIDVSMLETGLTLMSSTVTDYLHTGNEPKRRGNLANSRSPGAGSYQCKTGMISLGVNEESHFTRLANVLHRQDWLEDERFAQRAQRVVNAEAFSAELQHELQQFDASVIEQRLQLGGVPAACVRTLPECLASDQVAARQFIHKDSHTGLQVPTLPFRISGAAQHAPRCSAPSHGADTTEVLDWLQQSAGTESNHYTDIDAASESAEDAAVQQALAVMQAHITALNSRDASALAATLHFPHHRLSGTEMKTWETADSYFSDFLQRAGDEWSCSRFNNINVVQSASDKVHLSVEVQRFKQDGSLLTRFQSMWVITCLNNVWAATFRSSFASS